MKVETIKQLKVKLKGNDAENFKSALKKLSAEKKKAGFNSLLLTDDENKVIDAIIDKL
jgi:hypothetical protein